MAWTEDVSGILCFDAHELLVGGFHRVPYVKRQCGLELAPPITEALNIPLELVAPRRAVYDPRQDFLFRICVARVRALPDVLLRLVDEVLHTAGYGRVVFPCALVFVDVLEPMRQLSVSGSVRAS